MVNDSGAVARFQREAKALAKVSHPAIVQAYDAGEDRGQHFLVMEYVEGTNLGQVVKDKGRIGQRAWASTMTGWKAVRQRRTILFESAAADQRASARLNA